MISYLKAYRFFKQTLKFNPNIEFMLILIKCELSYFSFVQEYVASKNLDV